MRLDSALDTVAEEYADKLAISVLGGASARFGDLAERSRSMAGVLQSRGVAPGDRVGIVSNHDVNAVALFFAIARVGGIVVWLNNDMRAADLASVVEDAAPALVVAQTEKQLAQLMELSIAGLAVESLGDVVADAVSSEPVEALSVDDNDVATIVYTSGSSGRPKGVCLSHRNLSTVAEAVIEHMPISDDDSYLMVVPLHYIHGIMQLLVHVLAGASIHCLDSFVFPRKVVDALRETAVTGFSGVPFHFNALVTRGGFLDAELPALRWMTVTGGKLAETAIAEILDAFPNVNFHIAYGQTECAPRATALHPSKIRSKPDSVGAPIPGIRVLLLDDTGKEVESGEAGEVVIAGDNVMRGYWHDDAATAEVIDAEGRLHTGDIGRYDDDGDLFLVGRKSAMIKSAGERIMPEEIERVLERHPQVSEAVVVGVADSLYGQRVVAHVLPSDEGASINDEAFVTDVRAHCLAAIPLARAPREFHRWQSFPRKANGKPDRMIIAEQGEDTEQQ